MTTNANIRFEDWEAGQMKDPEFRAAVEELEPEYQVAREEMNLGKLFSAKWISVKDKLPNPGQKVLRYGKTWPWEDSYCDIGELVSHNGNRWADWGVTHWMPLPRPPQTDCHNAKKPTHISEAEAQKIEEIVEAFTMKKPSFWPKNPYPESIFPMPEERYAEIVPDPELRTALSGMLGREFWDIASESIWAAMLEAISNTLMGT